MVNQGNMAQDLSAVSALLERPHLERLLDEAFGKRLTTVVAGPGYGKTTLLAQWSRDIACAWYTVSSVDARLGSFASGLANALRPFAPAIEAGGEPMAAPDEAMRADALAAHLTSELERSLEHDLVLIIDDANALAASPSARLAAGLVRQCPEQLHLVLAGRADPPFPIQRLKGEGRVLELDASELAFSVAEVTELLDLLMGSGADGLAPRVHALTGGWPAAVRLAIGALVRISPDEREDALDGLRRPEGPLLSYLAEEVFGQEPTAVRELIRAVAHFERFSPELCEALGLVGSSEAIDSLRRKGLFVTPHGTGSGFLSLHGLVREYANERLRPDATELRELHRRAAAWFEGHGALEDAFSSLVASGDEAALAVFLGERGEELLSRGFIEPVLRAGAALSPAARSSRVDEILGEAHSLVGDWDEALACYQRVAGDAETLPPGLAWRTGRLYWDRGMLDEAASVFARGRIDRSDPEREALLLAWTASPYWSSGDIERARELAEQALEAAKAARSPRALAAAHNAVALNYLGRDSVLFERHITAALEAAKAAGDVLQVVRFTVNRCGPAEPKDAIEWLGEAISLAELAGADLYLARALNARGENRLALGHFDDAVADLRRALSLWERHGSARRAWALMSLASVARQRGDLAYARAAYEEALEISGDAEGRINARSGLARVLAYEDPEQARRLADEAVEEGRRLGYMLSQALLAAGWVALARGDGEDALALAREALAETHRHRIRFEYAEALELAAMTSPDRARQADVLAESAAVWREVGNQAALARVEFAIAHLAHDRAAVERARRRLRAAGVRDQAAGAAGLLGCLRPEQPAPARIRTLGSFALLRDEQPVAIGEWRSRKARDLLKILVARRGRVAPREYLMDALWPGEDPSRLGNRLSVALSLLRSVLDPEKRFEPDYYVSSGKGGVALRIEALPIDVEEFLADADAGLRCLREGNHDEARELLLEAEAAYAGDFLEEDAYEDWATMLREEARVAYVAVAHALAQLAAADGDLDGSARYLLRVLERDPYDERASIELVETLARAGRHGEARRCYAAYAARMEEIGVEAAPYPTPHGRARS